MARDENRAHSAARDREDVFADTIECVRVTARFHHLALDNDPCPAGPAPSEPVARIELCARAAGLRTRRVRRRWDRLSALPLPAIAPTRDGPRTLLAARDDAVLVHVPGEPAPVTLDRARFESCWDGTLVLVRPRRPEQAGQPRSGPAWFAAFLPAARVELTDALVASVLINLLGLATPVFFQVIVDKVLVHDATATLDVLAAGLLTVIAFEVTSGFLRGVLFAHTARRLDVALGGGLFDRLVRLPLNYFEARALGDSVARLRESETVRTAFTTTLLLGLVDCLFAGLFLVVLYCYSPALSRVVWVALLLLLVVAAALTPALRRKVEMRMRRGAENHAFLVEALTAIAAVKACAAEAVFQRRWDDRLCAAAEAAFDAARLANVATHLALLIERLLTLTVLWLGARLVLDGALTVGQLVAFNLIAARVSGPVLRVVQGWQDLQQALVAVGRLDDILQAPPEQPGGPRRGLRPAVHGAVAFERVSFTYPGQSERALEALTFAVAAGEVVGITGPSGSGKSTVARLLQLLHAPQAGRILIDGRDSRTLELGHLRRAIGVVPQDSVLLHASVRDNIAFADPGMPLAQVIAAARLAGADDFVSRLDGGYEAIVGERGTNLSGGERQRLALARALAAGPRILVLDEATSALDFESERVVHEQLPRIRQARTVIVIAHRLSALRPADRVLVLNRGQVVEAGTPPELIAAGGWFAAMSEHQSFYSAPAAG